MFWLIPSNSRLFSYTWQTWGKFMCTKEEKSKREREEISFSSKKGLLYLKSSNQLVIFPYYLKHTNLCITLLVICMDKKLKHVLVGFRLRPTNTWNRHFLVDFEGVFGGFGNDGYLSFQSEKLLPTISIGSELEHWTLEVRIGGPSYDFFSFENYGDQRHRKYFGPGLWYPWGTHFGKIVS